MAVIKIIDQSLKKDINIPNEPFTVYGKFIPSYVNGQWSYTSESSQTTSEITFPDENYDYDKMSENSVFVGAYDGDKCIGLAIYQKAMYKYMYLYDLKVSKAYRGSGIGRQLIDKGMEVAEEKGYVGIYTYCQDYNLASCLFYIKSGFEIGGFDNRVYDCSGLDGCADVVLYKKLNK